MPAKNTKEPTNREIMYEIKRTHMISLVTFLASVAVAGIILAVSNSYPVPQNSVWFGLSLWIVAFSYLCYVLYKYYKSR